MRFLAAPVFVLIAALLAPEAEPGSTGSGLHLRLVRSEPAADTILATAPATLRFIFSEAPDAKGAAVTMADHAGKAVTLGKAAPDRTDAKLLIVPVPGPLAAAAYRITWRVLSRDGHVVRGELGFTLRPAAQH